RDVPRADRPPVAITHVAFQLMVGCGVAMLAVAMLGAFLWLRSRALPDARWYLGLLVLASPLGLIAIEAGWTVTEVGRQPWIVYGVMRTAEAVTPVPGLVISLLIYSGLYLALGVIVVLLLLLQFRASPSAAELAGVLEIAA